MIDQLYRGYGVRIHTDDIDPAKTIGGINQYNVRDNPSVEQETTDGDVFASRTTLQAHDESMEFTSLNCDDVLDIIGTTGLCLKGDNSKTGLEFFLTALSECQPGTSPLANNIGYSAKSQASTAQNYGLLYPTSFSIPHSGNATFSFAAALKGLDGNAGITCLENATLPSIVDNKRRFGMGPVSVGGVELKGKQSVEIDFGVSLHKESADGSLYPDWIAIEKILAKITIRGISPQWAKNAGIPRGGRTFTHANTTFYSRLRNSDNLSGYEPDASAVHIKGTANGKAFVTDLASGNASASTQTALMLYVEKDGANAPLIFNTLQAIT